MRYAVLIALLVVTGCATTHDIVFSVDNVEVESWESLDPAGMNAQIAQAVASGEDWPTSPLAATVRLLEGDSDTRILRLEESKNRTEGADTTVVVLTRDGFLDDSVRGDWHRIVYERQPDRTWRIDSVRRAFRCYRQHHHESYSREWCP
jgi:hypothetical protein